MVAVPLEADRNKKEERENQNQIQDQNQDQDRAGQGRLQSVGGARGMQSHPQALSDTLERACRGRWASCVQLPTASSERRIRGGTGSSGLPRLMATSRYQQPIPEAPGTCATKALLHTSPTRLSILTPSRANVLRGFGSIKDLHLFAPRLQRCSAYQIHHNLIEFSTLTLASSLVSPTPHRSNTVVIR
ncbi:hypothetical protein EYF80_000275 [Liparis tanakae]|uniref:Uncharacterized protein n=1 Tax=Liparis tanakae TaxID=230148 RepID=A0A4Z2JK89_9TELE|nr:hypothetical protein EYF80_000275 [Liparis tanakae]